MRLSQEKNGELSLWDWQTGATRTLASSKHGFEDFVEVTCELGLIQEKTRSRSPIWRRKRPGLPSTVRIRSRRPWQRDAASAGKRGIRGPSPRA